MSQDPLSITSLKSILKAAKKLHWKEDTRLLLKLSQALAFIPEEDVYGAFNLIKQKTGTNGELVQFYDYVEDTFVGKVVQKKVGRGRGVKYISEYKAPLFEINFWNVNKRINECLPSLKILVESWHSSFSEILDKHPLVYSFIGSLNKEQQKVECELLKLETGIAYRRRP
ncbi:unnamed protein product, partial [Brachionus calyciflorus]